ncbi:MAG TPA: patatin-like phospholipase family protein [Candidatus Limnocylindrales bacterium]|nr:patatin-like phospholipase family protein [Candidatus Limnocylindrales bacterium]
MTTAVRVGLVLGGGGVLGGAWEIGALRALQAETGWDPRRAEYLIGTSVGALMAALLAAGILPPMDLVDAATRRAEAFPWPIPGSWDLGIRGMRAQGPRGWIMTVAGMLPRGGLSTGPIQESIRHRMPDGWPAGRRLWIAACDYRTGERVVFGRPGAPPAGVPAAVAASCAIPGVYRPVEIGGHLYVDGGLYSAANLDLLAGEAVDLAICLNPMSSPIVTPRAKRLSDRLLGFMERTAHRSLEAEAEALRASGISVMLIESGVEDRAAMGLNLMNRKRSQMVVRTAVRTVTQQLGSPPNAESLALLAGHRVR